MRFLLWKEQQRLWMLFKRQKFHMSSRKTDNHQRVPLERWYGGAYCRSSMYPCGQWFHHIEMIFKKQLSAPKCHFIEKSATMPSFERNSFLFASSLHWTKWSHLAQWTYWRELRAHSNRLHLLDVKKRDLERKSVGCQMK